MEFKLCKINIIWLIQVKQSFKKFFQENPLWGNEIFETWVYSIKLIFQIVNWRKSINLSQYSCNKKTVLSKKKKY